MTDGVLIQTSLEVAYRDVSFIRGVIAGDIVADAGLALGEARLVVNGREFSGSVLEIANGEAVFSAVHREEIVRALESSPDGRLPDPSRIR